MPRYNLNHDDVAIITEALTNSSLNASSTQQHNRIVNLKNRLLIKLTNYNDSSSEEIDVWSAFQGDK